MLKQEIENEMWHAEHDTDQQFEDRLLAGEITWFEPYLNITSKTSGNFGSRAYTMAQHGFAVDEIIRMRKTSRYMIAEVLIEELIKNGHAKEHYEDWAVHESKNIQRELAKNGYCLDTLLRVGEGDIQWAIAKYNPEHTLNYIKTKLDDSKHADGLELVMDQINPDPKALEYLLEHESHSTRHELAILEGKLYCGTHEPTPLEKTMTNYELYQSDSVWWMRDLTGNLITFRQFRKAQPEFKQAVLNKLKTYDIVPTTIEKTMSPEQLYQANNPLWMTGFSVEAIRVIFIMEEDLGRDTVADDCIDEFMLDCKHGMKPINALEKQLRKQNSLERAYQSWIRRN